MAGKCVRSTSSRKQTVKRWRCSTNCDSCTCELRAKAAPGATPPLRARVCGGAASDWCAPTYAGWESPTRHKGRGVGVKRAREVDLKHGPRPASPLPGAATAASHVRKCAERRARGRRRQGKGGHMSAPVGCTSWWSAPGSCTYRHAWLLLRPPRRLRWSRSLANPHRRSVKGASSLKFDP